MSLWCIGDIHGYINSYEKICQRIRKEDSEAITVQVGDLAIGFKDVQLPLLSKDDYFITGNHDNYKECQSMPNFLGTYGVKTISNYEFFFLSGAESIDRMTGRRGFPRIEGEDWWSWEELGYQEFKDAINEYSRVKPKIVISHDCPEIVYQNCFTYRNYSKTMMALTHMHEIHKPELWVFGHHHVSIDEDMDGTRFICLSPMQFKKVK